MSVLFTVPRAKVSQQRVLHRNHMGYINLRIVEPWMEGHIIQYSKYVLALMRELVFTVAPVVTTLYAKLPSWHDFGTWTLIEYLDLQNAQKNGPAYQHREYR